MTTQIWVRNSLMDFELFGYKLAKVDTTDTESEWDDEEIDD